MRRTLLAISIVLSASPTAFAEEHQHTSLGAHEHGVASLNLVVDGELVSLELDSPAANLVGFEHQPSSDEDRATVARVKTALEQADALFHFSPAADCALQQVELESPLFAEHEHEHEHHDDDHESHADHDAHQDEAGHHDHEHGEHADIEGRFDFTCSNPEQLEALTLPLFNSFPAMQRIQVQAITASGQVGAVLTADQPSLPLD